MERRSAVVPLFVVLPVRVERMNLPIALLAAEFEHVDGIL
jgi:hypothetical protein